MVPDEESSSLANPDIDTKLTSTVTATQAPPDTTVQAAEDTQNEQQTTQHPIVENVMSEVTETKEESVEHKESVPEDVSEPHVSLSEKAQIPDLKTSYGTTFDAVVTDDETTVKTTPHEEEKEEREELETQQDETEPQNETPLLPFTEDNTQSVGSVPEPEPPSEKQNDKPEDSMWTSFGDKVFSVVTGGEKTTYEEDVSSDDEDDDDEEEIIPPPKTFEEIKADKQPLDVKYPSSLTSSPVDDPKPVSDSEKPIFDQESEEGVVGPEETSVEEHKAQAMQQNEAEQRDEPTQQKTMELQQNEAMDLQENNSQGQLLDIKTDEPNKDKEEMLSESKITNENGDKRERSVTFEQEEKLEDNTTVDHQVIVDEPDRSIEKTQSHDVDLKNNEDIIVVEKPLDPILEGLDLDLENNTESEDFTKEDELSEDFSKENKQHLTEEVEKEKEELLEDENALSFSQSDASPADTTESQSGAEISTPEPEKSESLLTPTDPDSLSPETVPPVSTPEPEPVYSDDVLRLSILRDNFPEVKMARFQKYLSLKNLFKVEAMFVDLDTELQATRQSHTGSVQEIEITLERILEASENAILDEVEKMMDSRESKYSEDQDTDPKIDEETEILDDFQELAFSLRQKYSTVSDSTPLAEVTQDDDKGRLCFY